MQNYQAMSDYFKDIIMHYNHNHDPRNGQFTSGPSNGSINTAASKKQKYSKTQIENHRKEMINHYEKQGDKTSVKAYKEANENTIKMDLQHKENIKKALIISAAVVGTGLAVYMIYKYRLDKCLNVTASKSIDQLVNGGLSIDTASKVMTLNAHGKFINSKAATKKIMLGLGDEMDLVIKDPKFGKVTFGNPMKTIRNTEYVAFTKDDVDTYASMLKDWEAKGLGSGKRDKIINILRSSSDEFKIPSTKTQSKIIDELIAKDPSILDEVKKSLTNMAKRSHTRFPDETEAEWLAGVTNWVEKGLKENTKASSTVHALADHNPVLEKKISEAFMSKGYSGMVDLFDSIVGDGVFTDLPIIAFKDAIRLHI